MQKIIYVFLIIGLLSTSVWSADLKLYCTGQAYDGFGTIEFTEELSDKTFQGHRYKYVYVDGAKKFYYETDSQFNIHYLLPSSLSTVTFLIITQINRIDGSYVQEVFGDGSATALRHYEGTCSKASEKKF
jgi:hypothetical protein